MYLSIWERKQETITSFTCLQMNVDILYPETYLIYILWPQYKHLIYLASHLKLLHHVEAASNKADAL